MRLYLPSFAFLAALAVCPAAHANPLPDVFTLSYGGQTLTFVSPATPTPTTYLAGTYFSIEPVTTVMPPLGGGSSVSETLDFFTSTVNGGFAETYFGVDAQDGVVLFTGPVNDPTFIPGTYDYTSASGATGVLTITPTPEPSSFILLGTGLVCAAGLTLRRRETASRA
jgi:hypothetical protein